ncbi:alpha/beta hydrolase fold domain-containing protein [Paenibacillus sabinae]|uniref:Esterase/lipase n=1 Tax=Paenibacillus sabinae T27 TaxID=1268072 RepID=X4ZGA8_9BACL|nr:alpha/beta hydrolase fold domain-containing protein [Paenibacillus sabinae]AHV98566.1 esterase/lipase [Paenibacillus sabinae T27]
MSEQKSRSRHLVDPEFSSGMVMGSPVVDRTGNAALAAQHGFCCVAIYYRLAPEHPFAGEFVWTKGSNYFGWNPLLGHEPGQAEDIVLL